MRSPAPHKGLVIRGVSRQYGGRKVLTGVDLDVEPGTSVLVTGPNGAGKTTLLRVAAGVITADAGTVSLGGLDSEANRRAYQRQIAFLSAGDRGLYARLKVRQNLEFWARIAFIPPDRREAAIEAALDRFLLRDLKDRRTDRLSMGQRQRVRLAMTFCHEPALVLLDEPGSSLDQEGLDQLTRAWGDVVERGGAILWCAPTGDHESLPADRAYMVTEGALEPLGGPALEPVRLGSEVGP
jgi:ABC-2 type transport system ATP-binding protein